MKYVGVRQLKAELTRYLRAVEAGETLTVTTRKRPIAQVVPIKKRGDVEEILDALAQEGLLRRARRKPSPVARPLKTSKVRIGEAVLEDRRALL
ncbi:MAG: type II toxin-antitoxin system prevent-host-death family antitoxin [Acidobacteria bacterium]|nr:type II toxin-antitoxin system prevent-host-death family antitoxin [Acidobacteriota bacterium]